MPDRPGASPGIGCHHRFTPGRGYGVQRVYADDRSLDRGGWRSTAGTSCRCRAAGAAHGYAFFHRDAMAGPRRAWRFRNDPDHASPLKA